MLALPLLATAQLSNNKFKFLRGEGSVEKPYIIDSYESLVEFRELVALKKLYRDRYVKITADIDLGEDPNWGAIRCYDAAQENGSSFLGVVDGQGHTISHLTINKRIDACRTDEAYLGLFGRTEGEGTVLKNINLDEVSINVSLEAASNPSIDVHAGALVGYSSSTLQNVNVNGEIRVTDENNQAASTRSLNLGGLVGTYLNDGHLGYNIGGDGTPSGLNADINITSEALGSNIGGIAGYIEKVSLKDCTTSGMLTGRIVVSENSNLATDWNIYVGGICGYCKSDRPESLFEGLSSVCRVYGGNDSGGLIGHLYASFSMASSWVFLTNCYAAGGVSDAYSYSGGLIGRITKYDGSNVNTTIRLNNCYYVGTLTTLTTGKSKAMIGNYNGNRSYMAYEMNNCFFDKRMTIDNTDYQTLYGSGTAENMKKNIYGYDDPKDMIGTNPQFALIIRGYANSDEDDDDTDEVEWVFAEGRYPQLKSIMATPVSTLAVVPIYFQDNENAERVYLGARLTEASVNGEAASWSAPVGNGSVAGLKLMSDAVGYEILTLTAGTCAKRLNIFMANSDEKWEGEEHIPTGDKDEVFAGGNGTSRSPYIIMNAGQLAYAVKNNSQNEYYLIQHDIIINRNLLTETERAIPWIDTKKAAYSWKADLDGGGYLVHGMYLPSRANAGSAPQQDLGHQHGLLGSIAASGHVANMGMVETVITDDFSQISDSKSYVGSIAGTLESGAAMENCFTSGYIKLKAQEGLLYVGGICGKVSGSISDCLNATAVMSTERDVMGGQLGGIAGLADNAAISNCLNIGRVSYYGTPNQTGTGGICPGTGFASTDCYYDLQMTSCAESGQGMSASAMTDGTFFSGKSRWMVEKNHYPVLKTFADKEYMKLLSMPLTFSDTDRSANLAYIIELPLGGIQWSMTDGTECLNLFADYGLAEPTAAGTAVLSAMMNYAGGSNKACNLSFLTVPDKFTRGIRFVDPQAELACIDAFGGADGVLTLEEAMNVTDFKDFINHSATPSIGQFPEMKYFTGVTRLTNQLSSCSSMKEVELPIGLKTIAANAFAGCNSLDTVTMPVNLTKAESYAFRNSNIKEILVNTNNRNFVSREGVLFDKNEYIVAYPPKREGTSYMYTAPINGILTGAFPSNENLQTLYIGDDEGKYIDLKKNAIPFDMQVFVNDATDNSDYIDTYRYDESRDWQYFDDEGNLARYYPLKVTSAKYATMCINFDTELPEGVTAYYCTGLDGEKEGNVLFREIGREVYSGLPVLIRATKAGIYPLYEYDVEEVTLNDQSSLFQGSGEHGYIVGDQSASSGTQEGSILTLGHNSQGQLGFYFYRNDTNKIPAYRAYLVVDPLTAANGLTIGYENSDGIDSAGITDVQPQSQAIYDLTGRKVAEGADIRYLPKGIYIQNGKKIQVK